MKKVRNPIAPLLRNLKQKIIEDKRRKQREKISEKEIKDGKLKE